MASTLLLLSTLLLAALFQSARSYHYHADPHATSACVSSFVCAFQLSPDLEMRYKIILPHDYEFLHNVTEAEEKECSGCEVIVQLLYEGHAWLGIAPSPNGTMVGSRAAIGVPDTMDPRTHLLNGTDFSDVAAVPLEEETLQGVSCQFMDGQTVMEFRTSFADWGIKSPVGPSLNNRYTFVWAHGSDGPDAPTYHGPDHKSSFTITDFMGFYFSDLTEL